jgi:hypothetical protein
MVCSGKIITDDIITNALMWVPPEGYTGGSPVAGLQAPLTARPGKNNALTLVNKLLTIQLCVVVLEGVSTSQVCFLAHALFKKLIINRT